MKLGREQYFDYIKSEEWRQKSERIKDQADRTCYICGKQIKKGDKERLTVHHVNYNYLGEEEDACSSVVVLCWDCHKKLHDIHDNNPGLKIQLYKTEQEAEEYKKFKKWHQEFWAKPIIALIDEYFPYCVAGHKPRIGNIVTQLWDTEKMGYGCVSIRGIIASDIAKGLKKAKDEIE